MVVRLEDLLPVKTAHGVGVKFVLLKNEENISDLTQVAIGVLTTVDTIEKHRHPSMEEYYYFLEGDGTFTIGDKTFKCCPNSFVFVPSNAEHQLSTFNHIKFLYWGVAI